MNDKKDRLEENQIAEEELEDAAGGGALLQGRVLQGTSLQGSPVQGTSLQGSALSSGSLQTTRCSHGKLLATCEICGKSGAED